MDIEQLLTGTVYEEKAPCIARMFERVGITDDNGLRNAPNRMNSPKVCGEDLYAVVAAVRAGVEAGRPEGQLRACLGDALATLLIEAGYADPDVIRWASNEQLQEVDGVGPKTLDKIRDALPQHVTEEEVAHEPDPE